MNYTDWLTAHFMMKYEFGIGLQRTLTHPSLSIHYRASERDGLYKRTQEKLIRLFFNTFCLDGILVVDVCRIGLPSSTSLSTVRLVSF